MKKRLLSVLLCAGLIASLTVGCGGGKDAGKDGEKETLSVWLPPLDDETKKIMFRFLTNLKKRITVSWMCRLFRGILMKKSI